MIARQKLKKILTEWREFEFPDIYERDFKYSLLQAVNIITIIGARRTGKTYLCYQLLQYLRKSLPPDNLLYVNFEDERLYPIKGDELTELWEVYLELFSVDLSKPVYLFLDEIQNIPYWSKWARRITEQNKKLKLIITGSSSRLFGREIATELRGRTLNFTVYPLSFREYLRAQNIVIQPEKLKNLLNSKMRIIIKKQFQAYINSGGFPATLKNTMPQELLREYYKVMFYRDLIERHKIKNIKLLEDYLALALDQFSSLYTISSTAKKLESFGHSLSKNTLSNFTKYAQDVFLVFEAKKYSFQVKKQLRLPKKLYAIDHGLLKAVRFSFSEDLGRILENIVFIALKRTNQNIYYHLNKKECDFVLGEGKNIIQAIQVCLTLSDPRTRKREIEGLEEAMIDYKLKEGLILTEDERDVIKKDDKIIRVYPIWYWLINGLE